MSDPSKLDPSDWLSALVAGTLAGFAAFSAMFTRSKGHIYAKLSEQELRMDAYEKTVSAHETQLAVIHTNQDHLSARLDEIRVYSIDTNRKLDALLEKKS